MPDTLYEEATRCPSCEEPGRFVNKKPVRAPGVARGTVLEYYECRSDRCPQYLPPQLVGTSTRVPEERLRWAVQVNPDGSIPPKGSGASGPKAFESVAEFSGVAQKARDNLRYLAAKDERHGEAYEIRRDLDYRGGY